MATPPQPPAAAPPAAALLAVAQGSSAAAAAVVAAAFLAISAVVAVSLRRTAFRTYILLLASTLLRGVGFVLHAVVQAHVPGMPQRRAADVEAAFQAFRAAGFGMAIGVCALMFFSWFKNASSWAKPFGPRVAAAACIVARTQIPVVIIAGPILGGAVAAVLMFAPPQSPQHLAMAEQVRQASLWAQLVALAIIVGLAALAAASVLAGAARRPPGGAPAGSPASLRRDAHALVAVPIAAAVLLLPPMAQRVASLFDPSFRTSDAKFYPLAAAFEVLHAALLCPPVLLARACMAGGWPAYASGLAARRPGAGAGAGGGDGRAGAPAAKALSGGAERGSGELEVRATGSDAA